MLVFEHMGLSEWLISLINQSVYLVNVLCALICRCSAKHLKMQEQELLSSQSERY